MTAFLVFTFWAALVVLIYIYLGYPALLVVIQRILRKPKIERDDDLRPHVTLIVSAFNEERVIGAKLENALALDYPRDRLEIIVVSDCSTDRTDEIVLRRSPDGVRLIRMPRREGKTAG